MAMRVEGRMVCAVCGRVLDHVEGQGWRHTMAAHRPEDLDHPAVPVRDDEVPVRERCDFCYADETTWVLPARDFETIPGMAASSGDWGACDHCAALIEKDQWNALVRRVELSYRARHDDDFPGGEAILKRLYRLLRKNISGPLTRMEPEDG